MIREMIRNVIVPTILMAAISTQHSTPPPNARETDWSKYLAEQVGGDAEYRLPCGSRVDIYDQANGIAWEVEWDNKWPESVGQAIYYALSLDNPDREVDPGIWLLRKSASDEDYLQCLAVVRELRAHGINIHLQIQDARQ